jgi:hypothetical protein
MRLLPAKKLNLLKPHCCVTKWTDLKKKMRKWSCAIVVIDKAVDTAVADKAANSLGNTNPAVLRK